MIFLCRLNVAMIHPDGKQVSYINILVFQHGMSFYALFYRVETVLLSFKKEHFSIESNKANTKQIRQANHSEG